MIRAVHTPVAPALAVQALIAVGCPPAAHTLAVQALAVQALIAMGCAPADTAQVTLVGDLYDAAPEVVFADPAGPDAHLLEGGTLTAFRVGDASSWDDASADPAAGLAIGEASFSSSAPSAFSLDGPEIVEGAALTLVARGPDRAPTAFTGIVPEVSPRSGWFRFFDGALFTEPSSVVADRVRALSPKADQALPDPEADGNGCLVYGQLLSDPSLGEVAAVADAAVTIEVWDGAAFDEAIPARYLDADRRADPALETTSSSGIFFAVGVPAGPIRLAVTSPAGDLLDPAFETLCMEDGLAWLAAFFLPGIPASGG